MAKEAQNKFCFTVLTLIFVLAVAFSGYFVCTGLDHDCTGEDCQICLELGIVRGLLEGLGRLGLALLIAGFAALCAKGFAGNQPLFYAAILTPVFLKTKYNS